MRRYDIPDLWNRTAEVRGSIPLSSTSLERVKSTL